MTVSRGRPQGDAEAGSTYTNIPVETKTTATNSTNIDPWRRFLMEPNIDSAGARWSPERCVLLWSWAAQCSQCATVSQPLETSPAAKHSARYLPADLSGRRVQSYMSCMYSTHTGRSVSAD